MDSFESISCQSTRHIRTIVCCRWALRRLLLDRMRFEHDPSNIADLGSQMTRMRLAIRAGMWCAPRIVGAAHEEECVNGILLGLLARHSQNARLWRSRRSRRSTEVAVVLALG